jgi:hypothetical protein
MRAASMTEIAGRAVGFSVSSSAMTTLTRSIVVVAVMCAMSQRAMADSYLELLGGMAVPLADDDYEDNVEPSLKLGVRFASGNPGGGLEVGFDFTPVNIGFETGNFDVGIERYRIQAGGRFLRPVGSKAHVFGRAAAGLDIVHYSTSGQILGVEIEASETDVGIAFELGGGVLIDVGPVSIGGQLAIPFALHFEEDDPDDNNDADLEYTGIDLDLLFFVAIRL